MKVFIGGSRRVSRLHADVCARLDRIIEKGLPVLVGDANGADKGVQTYFARRDYKNVEVFCAESPRNNVGRWLLRRVAPSSARRKDAHYYSEKDRAMAAEASYGLMVWDGKSVGTLANVARLTKQGKIVVVYTCPTRQFADVKSEDDWRAFLAACSDDVREELADRLSPEERAAEPASPRQATLPL